MKLNKVLINIIILGFFDKVVLLAQPTLQWQTSLGGSDFDVALSIKQTKDGGYVAAGYTFSDNKDVSGNHGTADYWVVKLDSSGAFLWQRTLGGSNIEWANAICQTKDDGFILVGFTQSNDGDVAGFHGDKDAWIVKLDSMGAMAWQKCLGGSGWDEILNVEVTSDGGYIMAGKSSSNNGDLTHNNGYLDAWIVKLDSTGAIDWQKSYGGADEDAANAIMVTSSGGYVIVGETKSDDGDIIGNHGNVDIWTLNLNNSGEIIWSKAFGGCCWDVGTGVVENSEGFIIMGYVGSDDGDITNQHGLFDYWLAQVDTEGGVIWQTSLGGSDADWLYAATTVSDGGIFLTGTTRSSDGDVQNPDGGQDIWVVKLNKSGTILWQKTLGGSLAESGHAIYVTNDGGVVVAGRSSSDDGDATLNHGLPDFWVVKLAPESVGVKDLQGNTAGELHLTPNPAYETTRIQAAEIETSLQIVVVDVLGRKIQAQTLLNGETMSVSDLPTGLYSVHAVGDSGQRYSGRILKQ